MQLSRSKRFPFTLLEVMLVLVILGVASGICLWSLRGMIARHRFDAAVHRVYNHLISLQSVSLSQNCLFELQWSKKELLISTDEPHFSKQERIPLFGVTSLRCNGIEKETFTLTLYPPGRLSPPCRLDLRCESGEGFCLDLSHPLTIPLPKKIAPLDNELLSGGVDEIL